MHLYTVPRSHTLRSRETLWNINPVLQVSTNFVPFEVGTSPHTVSFWAVHPFWKTPPPLSRFQPTRQALVVILQAISQREASKGSCKCIGLSPSWCWEMMEFFIWSSSLSSKIRSAGLLSPSWFVYLKIILLLHDVINYILSINPKHFFGRVQGLKPATSLQGGVLTFSRSSSLVTDRISIRREQILVTSRSIIISFDLSAFVSCWVRTPGFYFCHRMFEMYHRKLVCSWVTTANNKIIWLGAWNIHKVAWFPSAMLTGVWFRLRRTQADSS